MDLIVTATAGSVHGVARFSDLSIPCLLGRSGIVADKREGDGGTPAGRFPFRRLLFRPDRCAAPVSPCFPAAPIRPNDGWCDDPAHASYNRPVRLPFSAGHERMWRDDALYDLVLVVGHNDDPPKAGAGSAVFVHLMSGSGTPTEGCVAFRAEHLTRILGQAGPNSALVVRLGG